MCQRALTQKQTLWGGGALERGHRALLEPLAQLGDALGGVGAAAAIVEAAELVAAQAAMSGARMVRDECQRALTQKQTLRRWLECPSSLLERLQRRVAFEALGERGSSLGTEVVDPETAGVGSRGGR